MTGFFDSNISSKALGSPARLSARGETCNRCQWVHISGQGHPPGGVEREELLACVAVLYQKMTVKHVPSVQHDWYVMVRAMLSATPARQIGDFMRQSTNYNCGPTALYNLLIWAAGSRLGAAPSEEIPRIFLQQLNCMCQCEPYYGTMFAPFCKAVESLVAYDELELSLECVKMQPRLREIREHLQRGGAVVLNFHWSSVSLPERYGDPSIDASQALRWEQARESGEAGDHYVLLESCTLRGIWVINWGADAPVRMLVSDHKIRELLWPFEYPEGTKYAASPEDRVHPKAWFFSRG